MGFGLRLCGWGQLEVVGFGSLRSLSFLLYFLVSPIWRIVLFGFLYFVCTPFCGSICFRSVALDVLFEHDGSLRLMPFDSVWYWLRA